MAGQNRQREKLGAADRSEGGRRPTRREGHQQTGEQTVGDRDRKLHSLLELGHIIGLDLQIDTMLLQIAGKAAEVMEADRCTLFLHDPTTDELWSTVALGMEGQAIRIPSGTGLAGFCFKNREVVNLGDVYVDPRFNRDVDARTGYRTRNLLCVPMHNRAGETLGVIQLLNKRGGSFTEEDATFLRAFGNHASIFIEMAQLQKARMDALEQSRDELRRLNRAKHRALHSLSHELKTPLAVIQGTVRLLKRRLASPSFPEHERLFELLERHLVRLLDIQQESDKIIRSYQNLSEEMFHEEFDRLGRELGEIRGVPSDVLAQWKDLREKVAQWLPSRAPPLKGVTLFPLVQEALEKAKERAKHRGICYFLEGRRDLSVLTEPEVLGRVIEGLLKNAIENTPDEGMIRIALEDAGHRSLLKVQDFGIGITDENQRYLFDGLFPTRETDLYSSKKPYEFGAGGKGLDLLLMRAQGKRFGFDLWVESRRCLYLSTDRDLCPGRISMCPHCRNLEDCLNSGGSTFGVFFSTQERGVS